MSINPSIFKAYDIRGIYPDDINEEKIVSIIKGVYTLFSSDIKKDNISIILGRDMRLSSPSLFEVAKKTLVSLGATVIDIGLSSTPTVYFATLFYKYDAGIQISASHNPKQYNGLKIVRRDGDKLIKIGKNTGMMKLKEIVKSDQFIGPKLGGQVISKSDVLKDEVEFAFDLVKPKSIKKLKIVADAANSMGALFIDEIIKRTPCELVKMNFELDGTFPAHPADPLVSKNLIDLQKRVLKEKADLGIAPDGDGDRLFFIDEKGKIIPPTIITSLIAKEVLQKNPGGKIIFDIRYIRNASKICGDLGGEISICPVGHALITEQLNKQGALFAGESSGHYFFKETGGAEAAIRILVHLLEILGRENRPISELVSELTTSVESGEYNFILPEKLDPKDFLIQVAHDYSNGTASWLDGLSVDFPDWRFNIRTSNTEPLLRINVEGETAELVNRELNILKQKILNVGAKSKD